MTNTDLPPITNKNVFLSGRPSSGKTTVMEMLAHLLAGRHLAGFLTLEIREHGQKVGFKAVGLNGQRVILAHVRSHSHRRVGRYGVGVERLDSLNAEELDRPVNEMDAFLVDEIGKMERLSPQFVAAVGRVLDGPVLVIATVALKGGARRTNPARKMKAGP